MSLETTTGELKLDKGFKQKKIMVSDCKTLKQK